MLCCPICRHIAEQVATTAEGIAAAAALYIPTDSQPRGPSLLAAGDSLAQHTSGAIALLQEGALNGTFIR